MKIVFIRHGEPTYDYVRDRGYIGHGLDLSQLTDAGKQQALAAAEDARLDGIELIVSSPYTRALQTAAIISKYRNIGIEIELDVHEWMPDLTFQYSSAETSFQASRLCSAHNGRCPDDSPVRYEELDAVFTRANSCLKKYLNYNKIAVVSHGIVIRQFAFAEKIPYCGISEIEFDDNFQWCSFVEKVE